MTTESQLSSIADLLDRLVGARSHTTVPKSVITSILRSVTSDPTSKIGCRTAQALQQRLQTRRLAAWPRIADATPTQQVRLYRTGTAVARLIEIVTDPTPAHDAELGATIRKIKGQWNRQTAATTEMAG